MNTLLLFFLGFLKSHDANWPYEIHGPCWPLGFCSVWVAFGGRWPFGPMALASQHHQKQQQWVGGPSKEQLWVDEGAELAEKTKENAELKAVFGILLRVSRF